MTAIIIIAACISAIATTAIAIYAGTSNKLANKNYQLAQEIKKANELRAKVDDEFREQISDLYEAIILSVFIAPEVKTTMGSTLQGRIRIFKQHYKGKTEIF